MMKCPICNAENAPDASSCSQCGFSLSLSQAAWPDLATLEILEPVSPLQWPETPTIEVPSAPIGDTLAIDVEGVEVEQVDRVEKEEKAEATAADAPPPDQPSDDELAREHIARGFEAIRQGMPDQARWELEQASDLADSEDIFRLAQSQLDELFSAAEPIVQSQPVPITPKRPVPIKTLSTILVSPADWASTTRTGAIAGAVNGLVTLISAQLCCGLFLSPAAAFIAGI
ncbi:MAG: zinc ribbon domain-containing protein, partial [Chloroflexota bacterium]|nr:zinc ribbon domain-containing protein [Chloroflexota bacterium]